MRPRWPTRRPSLPPGAAGAVDAPRTATCAPSSPRRRSASGTPAIWSRAPSVVGVPPRSGNAGERPSRPVRWPRRPRRWPSTTPPRCWRLLRRPAYCWRSGSRVVGLVASRGVLGGPLHGGRLLPADGGASDLWSAYTASWHPVGLGSTTAAPPFLAVLALASTVLLGKVWLAVHVLLLGAVPLAGLSAYAAAGRLTRGSGLRVFVAATYALTPVVTGAVSGGRLDVVLAVILLPLCVRAVVAALAAPRRDWHRWVGAGLVLSVVVACAPLVWPVAAAAVALAAALRLLRQPDSALAALVVLVLPALALLPWTVTLFGCAPAVRRRDRPSRVGVQCPAGRCRPTPPDAPRWPGPAPALGPRPGRAGRPRGAGPHPVRGCRPHRVRRVRGRRRRRRGRRAAVRAGRRRRDRALLAGGRVGHRRARCARRHGGGRRRCAGGPARSAASAGGSPRRSCWPGRPSPGPQRPVSRWIVRGVAGPLDRLRRAAASRLRRRRGRPADLPAGARAALRRRPRALRPRPPADRTPPR